MEENQDILIIEDSQATANLISDYLKQLNYKEIHTYKDSKAGIKKFLELSSSNRLPLVFLDYYLPETDIISLFDQFLEIEPETKIIIDTIIGKEEDGVKYLIQHGAYHYLQKPFSFENLKEMMNTFEKEQSTDLAKLWLELNFQY